MNEPKRLLDSGSGHLRALVEAGKGDQPNPHLQKKVLGALGLGAAGAGVMAGSSDVLARSGMARFFGALGHAALSKAGIGVIVAAATVSSAGYLAVHERGQEAAERSVTSVVPAPAPVASRPLAPEPSAADIPATPTTTSTPWVPSTASATGRPSASAGPSVLTGRPSASAGPAVLTGDSRERSVVDGTVATAHASKSKGASSASEARSPAIALQLESIRRVRDLVGVGDAHAALEELDAYEMRYPGGTFEEEAMALRVHALRMAGDAAGAERERTNLQSRFPKSVHLDALGH